MIILILKATALINTNRRNQDSATPSLSYLLRLFFLHNEIDQIKQAVVNNHFPIQLIDKTIKQFLNNAIRNNPEETPKKHKITLFYKNQMTSYYKNEEIQIRKIISDHVKLKEINTAINLLIYCKSRKLKNLIIKLKNNQNPTSVDSNVVYMYKCPEDGCNTTSEYIGHTTNKLRDCLQQHTYKGSI